MIALRTRVLLSYRACNMCVTTCYDELLNSLIDVHQCAIIHQIAYLTLCFLMLSQIRALNLMSRHVCLQDSAHITGLLFRANVEREFADAIN